MYQGIYRWTYKTIDEQEDALQA